MPPSPEDLALARALHQRGRLSQAALQAALGEVAPGRSLADVLVARRLMVPAELSGARPPHPGTTAGDRADDVPPGPVSSSPDARTRAGDEAAAALHDRAAWQVGGVVGRFRIERELGRGGMGVVYLGADVETRRSVAIKTLLPDAPAAAAARFKREGEAQAASDEHANVLRVHAAGEAGGRLFLIMDFAPGGDLARRLEAGPLPPLEAAAIARDLAHGLAHVHARGVLHRDLKPANVLFDDIGAPRLVDFGLAALEGAERLTRTGAFMGTPAYMAPEQADGAAVGVAADVYGLGAVLYHMLTGRPPFEDESSAALLYKLFNVQATPPRDVVRDVPVSLDRVVMKCLAKAPHQRYASAAALAADLDRAIRGVAVEAPALRRWRRAWLASLGVALALSAGAWWAITTAPVAAPAPAAPTRSSPAPAASAMPTDPLASPTFGLPTVARTYRCQWYTSTGSPALLSFRATLALGPAVVGPAGGVDCPATLSDLTVWGGRPGRPDELSPSVDHHYEDLSLPLRVTVTADGTLSVAGLSDEVRARLDGLLPAFARHNPENAGAAWPGLLVRDYLRDELLADLLQLSLPRLARDERGATPTGAGRLVFRRGLGPPILYTRLHEEVHAESVIDAAWVLDADRLLVSCTFTDRSRANDPSKAEHGECWWGLGPPEAFRANERRR